MRKSGIVLFLLNAMLSPCMAGNHSRLSVDVSYDRLLVSLSRSFSDDRLLAGFQTGPTDQDNEASWDDWMGRLLITLPVNLSEHHQINLSAGPGLYLPLTKECTPVTPFVSSSLQYCIYPGQRHRTFVSLTAGYQYGQRSCIQRAENPYFDMSSRSVFKLPPLELTVGFGFCW